MIQAILGFLSKLLSSLLRGAVDDWRRDRALERLGYTEAVRRQLEKESFEQDRQKAAADRYDADGGAEQRLSEHRF